ncbi:ATP synthase F1, gamma subunit [Syncephalastrum racemosum]|uniref:ATP synthase subunit gamma n=1 Tax=Syncephalastrum racemosum TaxID=13706 RepID=A0A1X2HFK0_SYNRA|nr:ATP synthase F1, gamma subunit [Syncephalastrum racemosum]
MLSSASRIAVRPAVAPISNGVQARNMATLKEIQLRLKSVSNIEKITKSMKMIASTKVTKAQRGMEAARAYGEASTAVYKNAETKAGTEGKTVFITVSSDSGLCGGIHSSVSKATKRALAQNPEAGIIVLGDKAKAQLSRAARKNMVLSFNQLGKDVPNFLIASTVANAIKESGAEFDSAKIIFNEFKSVIAYEPKDVPVFSEEAFKASPNFAQYEIEDDVLANMQEFNFANTILWGMAEGYASEMSAKRTAMENATKNAGEMITKLSMVYNRGRQAVITNELIDIITGASAL